MDIEAIMGQPIETTIRKINTGYKGMIENYNSIWVCYSHIMSCVAQSITVIYAAFSFISYCPLIPCITFITFFLNIVLLICVSLDQKDNATQEKHQKVSRFLFKQVCFTVFMVAMSLSFILDAYFDIKIVALQKLSLILAIISFIPTAFVVYMIIILLIVLIISPDSSQNVQLMNNHHYGLALANF
jgi:hypothetical protein